MVEVPSDWLKAFPTDSASGSIASFTDGADDLPLKSLVVDITPVQDLHGYDAPYPAGGGVNKFEPFEGTYDGVTWATQSDGTSKITGTALGAGWKYLFETYDLPWRGISAGDSVVVYSDVYMILQTWENDTWVSKAAPANRYVTATIPSNVTKIRIIQYPENVPATEGETYDIDAHYYIAKGSTFTSWSPYENICPISGWTGCEVNVTEYNVWDEQWENGGLSYGIPAYNPSRIRSKNYIVCKPNTTYYFKNGTDNGNLWIAFYDINKKYIDVANSGNGVVINHSIYTTPDKCHYMKFFLSAQTKYQHDVTINYPSTDHSYHPYTGRTIPISWADEAGTVYGGKLDVLSGVLRVDRATDDMGNLTWDAQWSAGRCYSTSKRSTIKKGTSAGGYDNAFAEIYSASNVPSIVNLQANQMSVDNGGIIQLYDTRFAGMTGTQIKAELEGVTMCYKLAEPIEIQLTPNQVNSLYGVNNLWADSGDTTAEYRADTKLFIERLTAPDSADMIADANITSGKYFMVGNNLYKATANIANGGQIIVGTNCIRKSLSEALNEINA